MDVIEHLRAKNLADLRACLAAKPKEAKPARYVVEAGRLGWREGLALLVRHGADLNASWRGYRALHSLIQEPPHGTVSRVKCLRWLLENGADPERLGAWPPARALLVAAFTGVPAYAAELLAAGARTDGFSAAALGDLNFVQRCLQSDAGFSVARDAAGWTALQCAAASRMGRQDQEAQRQLFQIASTLLDHGADTNARIHGWDREAGAVDLAASSGHREVYELLLARGAAATEALTAALWNKDTSLAEIAMRYGADPNAAIDSGKPLLVQMIRWGQLQQATWLIGKGANPNLADERGWTAVHQAASRGNERMLRAVLAAGGDRSRRDAEGRTPLAIAKRGGRAKIISMLE